MTHEKTMVDNVLRGCARQCCGGVALWLRVRFGQRWPLERCFLGLVSADIRDIEFSDVQDGQRRSITRGHSNYLAPTMSATI